MQTVSIETQVYNTMTFHNLKLIWFFEISECSCAINYHVLSAVPSSDLKLSIYVNHRREGVKKSIKRQEMINRNINISSTLHSKLGDYKCK